MVYDLVIKNGTVVDGSGAPRFQADVGVRDGKIAEVGKVRGSATRVIDADGLVVAPGFIDNHCHYDAQVTWDPLCTFSCHHGATSVVIGNCSLALAPARERDRERLLGMLSHVEAIPMEVLRKGVDWRWESIGQYMAMLDSRLGVNVGTLVGHSAVRYHAMGPESQEREATDAEVQAQQRTVAEALEQGALGLSVSRNTGHFDLEGRPLPAVVASMDEMVAVASVLSEAGTGTLQVGGGREPELEDAFFTKLSRRLGRPLLYNNISQRLAAPDEWRQHLSLVEQRCAEGSKAYPMFSPRKFTNRFTMKNCQVFVNLPAWKPVLLTSDEEKLRAFADPAVRRELYAEAVENRGGHWGRGFSGRWDVITVTSTALPKNGRFKGKNLVELATTQGKNVLDAFLDLAVEERLETGFEIAQINTDPEAVAEIIKSPHVVVGLSDGGAHVVFDIGCGYSTGMLAEYVRGRDVLKLEEAIRKLTSHSAAVFGITDRGLIRQGLAADIVVFDPETIAPNEPVMTNDLPGGGPRLMQTAEGIAWTIVNGQVLMEKGRPTGATPGRVLRNERYLKAHAA